MSPRLWKLSLLCLLLSVAATAAAQKNIVISEQLAAQSEKLPVKLGVQGFGKTWKMRFGDYAVVSSRAGWATVDTRTNFLNTRTSSTAASKFSFVLANRQGDSARVNAAENLSAEVIRELEVLPHIYLGGEHLLASSENLSAFLTLNNDTSELWVLLVSENAERDGEAARKGTLTNGKRKILLVAASSEGNGEDKRSLPALGYQFVENDRPLGALQYYGGGAMGMNRNIAWIDNSLDAQTKLLLAAAMTAVLQVKAVPLPDKF